MNNKSLAIGGVIGLIGGLILSPVLFAGKAIDTTQQTATAFDQHFIEEMIPHRQGAMAMAELALERSKRPEIQTLAKAILEAQKKEIDQMTAWHTAWFENPAGQSKTGHVQDEHLHDDHMDTMAGDMELLMTAKDFDLEFIRQMIPHHEMAVMMAQMLKVGTTRPPMKTLADQIITSQSGEIYSMRTWQKAWTK
ncbi:MAG: DUF305 domain-containing protein [bacterium]|nr:DUF305 domain-containing protein [bacterium]